MPGLMTRAVMMLLIVRAIAAPVALRPKTAGYAYVHGLALRVCAWPQQRLQRFSASSKLLQLRQGRNRVVADHSDRPPGFRSVWSARPRSTGPQGVSRICGMPAFLSTRRLRC